MILFGFLLIYNKPSKVSGYEFVFVYLYKILLCINLGEKKQDQPTNVKIIDANTIHFFNNLSTYHSLYFSDAQVITFQDPRRPIDIAAWRAAYDNSLQFKQAYNLVNKAPNKSKRIQHKDYKIENHYLKVLLLGGWRICVPNNKDIKRDLFKQFHDSPFVGHPGIKKTVSLITQFYYWPNINDDVLKYIKTCKVCQTAKPSKISKQGLIQSIEVSPKRWEQISMDFITHLPEGPDGSNTIWTIVDYATKCTHLIPISDTTKAEDLIKIFHREYVRLHGFPKCIITDRDPKFTSKCWATWCAKMKVKRSLSTAYHPQTDGNTERCHRTIEQLLRCMMMENKEDWMTWLPFAELAYNTTKHSTTDFSPFQLVYGENPDLPQYMFVRDNDEYIDRPWDYKAKLELAMKNILLAQEQQRLYANKDRKDVEFEVGDRVLLSTKFLPLKEPKPFKDRFVGPFKILEKYGPRTYKLKLPPTWRIHPVIDIVLLKLVDEDYDDANANLPELSDADFSCYEIEKVLMQDLKNPNLYYVRWKDFGENYDCWLHKVLIPDQIIHEYEEALKKRSDAKENVVTRSGRPVKPSVKAREAYSDIQSSYNFHTKVEEDYQDMDCSL